MTDNNKNETITSLLHTIALIREAAGVNEKPMLSELPDVIRKLREERDEARQEICIRECDTLGAVFSGSPATPQDYAEEMGWDCFNTPKPKVDKTLKGVIIDGGKAVPPKYEDLDNG